MKKFVSAKVANSMMINTVSYSLIALLCAFFFGDKNSLYARCIWFFIASVGFTFARYYISNFYALLAVHFLPVAAIALIPVSIKIKAFLLIASILVVTFSLGMRNAERKTSLTANPWYILVFIAFFIISGYRSFNSAEKYLTAFAVLYGICYIYAFGTVNLEKYIALNKDLADFPVSTVRASGIAENIITTVFAFAVLAILPYKKLKPLSSKISAVVYKLINEIKSHFNFNNIGENYEYNNLNEIGKADQKMLDFAQNFFGENQESGWLVNFLTVFGRVVAVAVVICALIYALYRLSDFVLNSYRRFQSAEKNDIDIHERIEKEYKKEKKKKNLFFRKLPESKIRRAFIRRAEKENKTIDKALTPQRLVSDARLVEEYERERYGKEKET